MIAPASQSRFLERRPRTGITPIWADIPAFTAFAHDVEDALDGQELRHSQRLKLLERAAHFGIRRFDANLVIAMVQNRVQGSAVGGQKGDDQVRQRSFPLASMAVFVATQSLIVAAVWWLLH